eukprot:s2375_g11.t1
MASDLDAVCRSEAQRVTTALRANRRWSQNRSWGHEEASPLRQLCTWRLGSGGATELLEPRQKAFCFWRGGREDEPLLRILRSAEFGGPATFVALEAAHNVVVAVCEEHRTEIHESCALFAPLLILRDGLICHALISSQDRVRAFSKVLAVWSHYRQSHMLRASAQAALQRILDACLVDLASPARCDFLRLVLGNMAAEAEPGMPLERALLYLRCLQRLAMHPSSRRWAFGDGTQGRFFQNDIPLLLLSLCKLFPGSLPLLSLVLPVVNRICWLCVDFWAERAVATPAALGALQVDALLSGVYIRSLEFAASPRVVYGS